MLRKITIFLEMIKFSHTVFALPFALAGGLLAAGGLPTAGKLLWIVLAMVGARTAAMGLNRLIDAEIDARNPRTAGRAIPAGLIGKGTTLLFIVLSLALLLVSSARLNPLCLKLSPLAVFFLVLYSYCKRFTSLAHVVLGICLAAAPIGAWVAIRGRIDAPALILGGAVLFWVAGFDILYALQDLEFDRNAGLHSIPVALGVEGSLWMARIFHLVMLALLLGLFTTLRLGGFFMAGIVVTAGMLLYEHWLLRDGNLDRLDAAFFNMNGYISLVMLASTAADVLAR
ncbi:4-hydroxybenzoate octaprenyltransferase [Geobacter sp. SVR]|uniref:4-hydroxybenzoate octaprenyltransferase n=1 Tax=Geobacter sp. SVR TaxID=2495594 RepID=UPI00143EF7DC|nr:4-hydroxybenzoate octaprenyltransferase [Geobacter sp. SVR]BCS51748.1 4-hydroxybenzoate octaprenyltransferase [Geobacter sp. SVR]GCF84935.1 4-hydroxybenzoate octaprenyltransferase [Geobacter sp. SVR]